MISSNILKMVFKMSTSSWGEIVLDRAVNPIWRIG
jgi:hypothetical protein